MHTEAYHPDSEFLPNNETRAREITRDLELVDKTLTPDALRFAHIREKLVGESLLAREVARVQETYGEELGVFGETLEHDVWEMLTILDLFDTETARHCVDTYHIAKSKVEKTLFSGIKLADSFAQEGVDTHTFFVSCLLHDIGKIEVPHAVLVNHVSDRECAELLFAHIDDVFIPRLRTYTEGTATPERDTISSPEKLLTYLEEVARVRPQEITPVRLLLTDLDSGAVEEVTQQLSHCGRTLDDSLVDIMRTHDRYSHDILQSTGHEIEADIAGAHHRRGKKAYTITVGTLQVSVDLAEIIHLADVENAIMSTRHYKTDHTSLEALKVLTFHARAGFVDSYIAYLWIADELHKRRGTVTIGRFEERKNYELVTEFLESEMRVHPEYPNWKIVH